MAQQYATSGWQVESQNRSHILPSTLMEEWEAALGVTSLPEMIFADNHVTFRHTTGLTLNFNSRDALREALHRPGEEDVPVVTYAAHWQKKDHGPVPLSEGGASQGMRWTFQTDYEGTLRYAADPEKEVPMVDTEDGINYDMLRDTSQPIQCSDSVVLYEDELHDCGVSRCLVRYRVMPNCFFILLRHWLRVDAVVSRIRDTRFFHEFGTDWVIRESCCKSMALPKVPVCDQVDVPFPTYDNPDEHQHLMRTTHQHLVRIPLASV
eukprot:GGOE01019455.1.p1 GENE.GGOE01019455.1~~GGOE01019455.1.p1  ORF type:complete len:289 (+),score=74.68 GGOE01019455.1:73-867(+)